MKVKTIEGPTPHILLEDVFTDEQLKSIWTELEFLHPSLVDGSNTAPAKSDDGVILKQNTGMFLYETYQDSVVSPICENTAMVAWRSSLRDFWSSSWTKTMYDKTNWDAIMVSYYGDTDYYHPHHDESVFTMLLWLWKEPKKFSGGNLYFPDVNHAVECRNNCGIIFMSTETHGVQPVELNEEGYGRYCISMFSGISNNPPN